MMDDLLILMGIVRDLAPLIVSVVAIWLTSRYQRHSKKLANDRMMKELFTEFNERYNVINHDLDIVSKLHSVQWKNLDKTERTKYGGVIIDFFNICAEEYHWHKEGRINGNIWISWSKGMNDIYNRSQVIKDMWDTECKEEGYKSYYITRPNEIFTNMNL